MIMFAFLILVPFSAVVWWFILNYESVELFWYRQTGRQQISEERRRRQARILMLLTLPALLIILAVLLISLALVVIYMVITN